jgi:hypothetical protein
MFIVSQMARRMKAHDEISQHFDGNILLHFNLENLYMHKSEQLERFKLVLA